MSAHIETRKKLKNVCKVSEFENLIDGCTLTDDEKSIVRLFYLNGKNMGYIADLLGYSETTVKRKHRHALEKLHNLL